MFAAAATPIACSNAVLICIDSCYLHPSTCNSELLQAQQKGMWNELIKATLSATAHDKFGGSRSFPIQIIQSCSTTLNTRPKLLELKGSCPSHLQVKDSKKQEIFKFKLSQIISNSSSSIHQTIRERACARRGSRGQWSIQYGHAMTRVQKAKRFQTLTLSNLDLVLNSLRKWREVIKSSRKLPETARTWMISRILAWIRWSHNVTTRHLIWGDLPRSSCVFMSCHHMIHFYKV